MFVKIRKTQRERESGRIEENETEGKWRRRERKERRPYLRTCENERERETGSQTERQTDRQNENMDLDGFKGAREGYREK